MKKFYVATLFLILSQLTIAQNYGLEWVKQMGGISDDLGSSITTDDNGNVYSTGKFDGTVDFDPGPTTLNLTSVGSKDIFIQKLDTAGNLLWVKQIGGTSFDFGKSITTDVSDNVYTTGRFYGTVDFDPGVGIFNLTSSGDFDIFILKLDAAGNLLWIKQMGGTSNDEGYSIITDAGGNVYTTGWFKGTADFDPGAVITNLTSAGEEDIFILKLSPAGNLLWVKQMGGTYYDKGFSITTDAISNVYTTGYFYGTVDFDPGAGTANLTSANYQDIFIQKLDSSGNFLWAKKMGSTLDDEGNSITTDPSGNVYTTGYFYGTVDFDPGVGITNLTSTEKSDIFIQKLDGSGNLLWAKKIGGSSYDEGRSITTDAVGNVYTTGSFGSIVDFNPGAGNTNLTSAGASDIFIQKLDGAGNFLWAKKMGGTSVDYGHSITTDADGNVYTTGFFGDTADFDPGAGTANLTSVGKSDIFIQKLDAAGNLLWVKQMGGTYYDYGMSITTDASSNVYTTGNFWYTADFEPGAGTTNLTSVAYDDIFIQKLSQCNVDVSLTITDPTITANASGASYQWLDCNNNFAAITGETAQSFTATANGDYAVEVAQNTCVDTSQCVTISTVGINASTPLSVHGIKVYPNPTTGKIIIEGQGIETIEIINPIGQTIKQYTPNNKSILIDISSQTKGLYFLRITTNNGVVIDKVLLE